MNFDSFCTTLQKDRQVIRLAGQRTQRYWRFTGVTRLRSDCPARAASVTVVSFSTIWKLSYPDTQSLQGCISLAAWTPQGLYRWESSIFGNSGSRARLEETEMFAIRISSIATFLRMPEKAESRDLLFRKSLSIRVFRIIDSSQKYRNFIIRIYIQDFRARPRKFHSLQSNR